MFVRLTKARRLKAGWLLALLYMLCVLAAPASFAFSGGSKLAPCLTDHNHELGIFHLHSGGEMHQHSDSDQARLDRTVVIDVAVAADDAPGEADHQHKAVGPQCCGMVCVSALPTTITEVIKPSAPISVRIVERSQDVADNAPPRHYRPPIS